MEDQMNNQAIKVEPIGKSYAVYFPFALKDMFKEAFPSAKWNRWGKYWEVGPRAGKRLDAWVEAVKDEAEAIVAEIRETEETIFSAKEIEALKKQVQKIRMDVEAAEKEKRALWETVEAFEPLQNELEASKKELEAIKAEKEKSLAEAEELLGKACEIEVIKKARDTIFECYNRIGTRYRHGFNFSQNDLYEQQQRLKELGLYSVGLRMLINANYNRPDRDNVKEVTWELILKIKKLDE